MSEGVIQNIKAMQDALKEQRECMNGLNNCDPENPHMINYWTYRLQAADELIQAVVHQGRRDFLVKGKDRGTDGTDHYGRIRSFTSHR